MRDERLCSLDCYFAVDCSSYRTDVLHVCGRNTRKEYWSYGPKATLQCIMWIDKQYLDLSILRRYSKQWQVSRWSLPVNRKKGINLDSVLGGKVLHPFQRSRTPTTWYGSIDEMYWWIGYSLRPLQTIYFNLFLQLDQTWPYLFPQGAVAIVTAPSTLLLGHVTPKEYK